MARRDDDDIEALLAEVDRTLSGRSSRPPTPRPAPRQERDVVAPQSPGGWRDEVARRTRTAGISAVLAAAAIFALFAVIPFLGSVSGAAGAAIATFLVVLLLPRRR